MDLAQLNWLSATDAARAIRDGAIDSVQLTQACLARVDQVDDKVQAWAFLDPKHALDQARVRDEERRQGKATGPLHGVPVAIKDIIDTEDMPTEDGCTLHAGRTPMHDASVVGMLRAAGAVIFGKTVTTELATYAPGKTRNPHNPEHTPGGSSSGSAAAVAAGMVPLALGTQSNGSLIRPASFCGTYAFKPTFGLVPRGGVLTLSRSLDQVGCFARNLEDIALLGEQLVGHDLRDPDTRPHARPRFVAAVAEEPPFPPTLAWMKGPVWDRASEETREAFAELVATLGDRVVEIDLPELTQQALYWHQTIMEAEMAANLDAEWKKGREQLSSSLQAQLERGRSISAVDYQLAKVRASRIHSGFDEIFERCDAIITPATPGTAPLGLESTGDPAFCTLWTLCGMPALNLPLMHGENGLPLGVQLVGQRGCDARLLRTARWMSTQLMTG